MYYGTDRKGWDEFWSTRLGLTKKGREPFIKNFAVMEEIMKGHFGPLLNYDGMETCEVGSGRGTISDMLNVRGAITHCCDLRDRLIYSNHYYEDCDITRDTPFEEMKFDMVFTYGLLEHFNSSVRSGSCLRMNDMLKPGGLALHYIVPQKWTNLREDKSIARYHCTEFLLEKGDMWYASREIGIIHVFPWLSKMKWVCDPFWSKGFFIYNKREPNENPSFSDSKESVNESTTQE